MFLKQMYRFHIIVAMLFSIYFLWTITNQTTKDPIYNAILIGLMWASLIFYRYAKPYLIQTITFTFAFISGLYGFLIHTHGDYSFLNALYSTFRLFLLNMDPVLTETESLFFQLPLSLEIARWSAALYTISTVSLFIFRYAGQSLLGIWLRIRGGHIIVFGTGTQATRFVHTLKNEGKSVAVVGSAMEKREKDLLHKRGIVYHEAKKVDPPLFSKIGGKKAKYIIIFTEDDAKNLDFYISLQDYLTNKKNHLQKVMGKVLQPFPNRRITQEILVHLNHVTSQQLFKSMAQDKNPKTISRSFNTHDVMAQKFLHDNPLYTGHEKRLQDPQGEALHLLFIGFGKSNQQLAYQILHRGHFMTQKPIRMTIFDKDKKKVEKEWRYLANYSNKVAQILFKEIDLLQEDVAGELKNVEKEITHAFVSLKDDFLDMIEGLELKDLLPNASIYIKMKDDHLVSKWLHEHKNEYVSIKRYIFLREILNSEYILDEKLQTLAKAAHDNYQQYKEELGLQPDLPWEQLDVFTQESNRSQMLHNDTKLMLLGLKKIPLSVAQRNGASDEVIATNEEYLTFIEQYVDKLAQIEHNRWNAFHYLRGWDTLPIKEVTKTYRKDSNRKLHACLVSWNELDLVREKTGTDFKKYDRNTIENLFQYYYAQGYLLKKE
ncbi:hypothetical protein ACERII_12455 [Evansella sp. AB-rgal1]|uniref:hypothetical protein n=1 Tax=Evansella sp. AB-rgal1 TaxID=3242696 RepID=UPI00359DEC2A